MKKVLYVFALGSLFACASPAEERADELEDQAEESADEMEDMQEDTDTTAVIE